MQSNYLQNIFEWYNGMKLSDTIHEHSNSMQTSVSKQPLKMWHGLKSKFKGFFLSFAIVFIIIICLALVKVTLFPYSVTFLGFKACSQYS